MTNKKEMSKKELKRTKGGVDKSSPNLIKIDKSTPLATDDQKTRVKGMYDKVPGVR